MEKKPRSTKRGIDKVARAVTKAVGGRDFARYIGQSIAKKKNSNVKKTVTKKQAFKSGAKIGLAIATLGSGAAITRGKQRNYSRGANYGDISLGVVTEIALTAGQYIEVGTIVEDTDAVYTINSIVADCELIIRRVA